MDRVAFLSRLASARREWDQVLEGLARERMEESSLAGGWSVKDVVAHVAWSEREMVGVIRQKALIGSPLWELGQDERNAIVVAENRERDLDDVLEEERRVYAELLPLLEGLTTEELENGDRWQQMLPNVPPWRIFAGSTFLHYEEHAAMIAAWL